MESVMIKNIVFDLGGVLVDWDPKYVFRDVFDTETEVDWFLDNICTMAWNVQQDAGRTLEEATITLQEKHPEWHAQIAAYYGRWEEMLKGPVQGTLDIFSEIKASNKFNTFALTNWSAETFPVAQSKYEFLKWFDGIVVSGIEKCIKPAPRIYKILLERFALRPSECLFIDDNKSNVAGALALGIQAIWFRSSQQLKEDLQDMKIIK